MIMFTVLAAGVAVLATGAVIAKPAPGKYANTPTGNVVSVLGLCSKANRAHFEIVLNSELDEVPQGEDAPGFHVVVMDMDDGTVVGASRKFASALRLVRQKDPRLLVGLVTDAQGLLFYAAHLADTRDDESKQEHPDFLICISPASGEGAVNFKADTRPWACDGEDKSVAKTEELFKNIDDKTLVKVAAHKARIIQGMESPFHGCVDDAPYAQPVDVPGRGFLVYDVERLCGNRGKTGGAEPTAEELRAARDARRAAEPAAERRPLFGADAYRGEMLLEGRLRDAADYLVSGIDIPVHAELAGAEQRFVAAADWGTKMAASAGVGR